jgi:hypothetical protein
MRQVEQGGYRQKKRGEPRKILRAKYGLWAQGLGLQLLYCSVPEGNAASLTYYYWSKTSGGAGTAEPLNTTIVMKQGDFNPHPQEV